MKQSFELPFGEYLPDQADYKNPGLVLANNAYPSPGGYSPLATAVASDDAVSEPVIGARLFFKNDGNTIICGGTATTLFSLSGSVTSTAGYTTATSWRFERFSDLIVAVSKENATQYLDDLDTDTSWSALPGSPPKASVIGRVADFLVLGNVDDGTDYPNRVQWSAFNNPTANWVTDRGELSDYRDLDPKYGNVTGIVGGRWGLVFQQRAIWRMVFVGSPKVFDFELVADDRGCIAPDSIVTIGYETYFLDQGGFFVTNGSDVVPIGDSRINEWFEDETDAARRSTVAGAINWPKRCIVWNYKGEGDGDDYQRQLIYSFVTKEFSTATQTVQWFVQANQDALTLADLAVLFPSGLGSMSAYEIGTAEWKAKDRLFAAFIGVGSAVLLAEDGSVLVDENGDTLLAETGTGSSFFATMTGTNAQAQFTTGDYSIAPGARAMVDGLRPMVELSSGSVTLATRSRASQGAAYAVTNEIAVGADGYAPMHVDNWFHSFRLTIAAGAVWDKAKGLWVRVKRTGRR